MNWCMSFLLTFAIILQIISVEPIKLCLNKHGNCDDEIIPNHLQIVAPIMDGPSLLVNGFVDFNVTATASKNVALQGLQQAITIAASHPSSALKIINDAIRDCEDMFYKSGTFVLLSLGKALTHSSECASRDDLVSEFQEIQYIALSLLDTLRTSISLAFQGVGVADSVSHQVIEAINQDIIGIYDALFNEIPIALEGTVKAITQKRSPPTYQLDMTHGNNNYNAIANDVDAQKPITDLNKATVEAIHNGADPAKAIKFKNVITKLLNDFAIVAAYNENSIEKFRNTVGIDPTLAQNSFIDSSDEVKSRIQRLFTNICLEYGSVNDKLSQEQIGGAFVSVEHGNDEVNYANKISRETLLGSLKYSCNIRDVMINAAADIMKYGKISFYERTVQGAELILKALCQ